MGERKKVSFELEGRPDTRTRVILNPGKTYQQLLADLETATFSESIKVTGIQDDDGCKIINTEDILTGDRLIVTYEPKAPEVAVKDASQPAQKLSAVKADAPQASLPVAATDTSGMDVDADSAVESQVLTASRMSDFVLERVLGGGANGMVFAARCIRKGIPDKTKLYALKLVFNFGMTTHQTRNSFENEYDVLSQLPPHQNLTKFWTQFVDEIPEQAVHHLPSQAKQEAVYADHTGQTKRRKAQFIVLDYHPTTLSKHRVPFPRPLPFGLLLLYARDLLDGVAHMMARNTVHLDLKLSNVLVAKDGRLVICDFGTAKCFDSTDMSLELRKGEPIGGNYMHLAPEVLNAVANIPATSTATVNYEKQEIWATGVLIWELAMGVPPWPDYPSDVRQSAFIHYSEIPQLPSEYPADFRRMVTNMLSLHADDRESAAEYLRQVTRMLENMEEERRESLPVPGSASRVDRSVEDMDLDGEEEGGAANGSGKALRDQYDAELARAPVEDDSALGGIVVPIHVRDLTGIMASVEITTGQTVDSLLRESLRQLRGSGGGRPPAQVVQDAVSRGARVAEGYVPANPFLLFAGTRLGPQQRIKDLGLDEESCVHLVWQPALETALVDVEMASSRPTTGLGFQSSTRERSSAHEFHDGLRVDGPVFNRDVHNSVTIFGNQRELETRGKWSTVLFDHPGYTSGRHIWSVQLVQAEPRCGMAVGIAHLDAGFVPASHNIGAHEHSWAYSKTGKKGSGEGFQKYGLAYAPGDIITCILDMDEGWIRFMLNGLDQGPAFTSGLKGIRAMPAICIGSHDGNIYARARILPGAAVPVRIFRVDGEGRHPRIQVLHDGLTVRNEDKWATVLACHPGVSANRLVFSVRVDRADSGAGVALGVIDPSVFNPRQHNLGASAGSWAYSKTGKKCAEHGVGWQDYGAVFRTGDVITCVVDMERKCINFLLNGMDQGVAYGPDAGFVKASKLVPAICMGSTKGSTVSEVSFVPQPFRMVNHFHRQLRNPRVQLRLPCDRSHDDQLSGLPLRQAVTKNSFDQIPYEVHLSTWDRALQLSRSRGEKGISGVETQDKWGSVFAETFDSVSGCITFGVKIDYAASGAGVAIGVARQYDFRPTRHNLGAAAGSWCYSKTGKSSNFASGFLHYGQSFKTGDIITVHLDYDKDELSFLLNGRSQGVAFAGQFADVRLVPCVCVGSAEGKALSQVSLVPPDVHLFDRNKRNKRLDLSSDETMVINSGKWATAVVQHPGFINGTLRCFFQVDEAESGSGFTIGLVDVARFAPRASNLGAAQGSWAFSKSGKKSSGHGFERYGTKVRKGDRVGFVCTIDQSAHSARLEFFVNGIGQGVAFTQLDGLLNKVLAPAVCLGSDNGGVAVRLHIIAAEDGLRNSAGEIPLDRPPATVPQ